METFGTRVFGVHLKDVKDAQDFHDPGPGRSADRRSPQDAGTKQVRLLLAIEYEENPENPVDDIKACLAEAAKAIAEVRKA